MLVGAPLFSSDRYNDEGRVYIFESNRGASTVSALIYKLFHKWPGGSLRMCGCKVLKGVCCHLR